MFITRRKYHSDISAAYVEGLEHGYELVRKLKKIGDKKEYNPKSSLDIHQLEESSLLLRQLDDIVGRKGIDLE